MDLEKMLRQLVRCTIDAMSKKLRDNNKIRLSSGELLQKSVVVDRVHKTVFEAAYGSKFTPDEVAKRNLKYHLRTMDKVVSMLGSAVVRIYKSGDICIVAPWAVLTSALPEHSEFSAGKLVLPITKGPVATVCFLPCGGLDFDTDQVPSWAEEIKLSRIATQFDIKCHEVLWREGRGPFTVVKGKSEASIIPGQVNVGDFIKSNGESHMVKTVDGEDAFIGNAERIVFSEKWDRGRNQGTFKIAEVPFLYGVIRAVPNENLQDRECVELSLMNLTDDIGSLKVCFYNARFNACGFMVNDDHIFLD